jgi:hypothetical protein
LLTLLLLPALIMAVGAWLLEPEFAKAK